MRDGSVAGIAVVVVLVAVDPVVGVVAEGLVGDAGERAGPALAVADVVVAVGDGAVLAILDRARHGLGLQAAEAIVGIPGSAMVELFRPGALAGAGGVVFPAVDDCVGGAVGSSRRPSSAHYVRLDPRKHADIVT